MSRRRLALTLAGAAMVAFALTGAHVRAGSARPFATPTQAPSISWADAKHRYGWVSSAAPRYRCARDSNVLCATEDGGKHWRMIFSGGTYIFSYLRWSKDAGVVSTGAYGHFEYWTRDGGRHWWSTPVFRSGDYPDANGYSSAPRFWVGRGEGGRRQLRYDFNVPSEPPYRVLGWVPTQPLTCAGTWGREWEEPGAIGPKNVCKRGPVGGDGMSAVPVGPAARLTVTVESDTGEGLVTSLPSGIECGSFTPSIGPTYQRTACTASFPRGTTVSLRPSANPPREVAWTGCTSQPPPQGWSSLGAQPWCDVTLTGDVRVIATFGH